MSNERHQMLSIIENHKEAMGSGDYLKLCNLLMKVGAPVVVVDEDVERNQRLVRQNYRLYESRILNLERTVHDLQSTIDRYVMLERRQMNLIDEGIKEKLDNLNQIQHRIVNLHKLKGIGAKTSQKVLNYLLYQEE